MEHYITLFDSLYMPQGLALHSSLERHGGNYTLWVLCMDEACFTALEQLALPNVRLLALAECETDELRAVKPDRNRAEYCWTLTPFTPSFVFARDAQAERVTYLDADLWFVDSPAPLFAELEASGKGVLITEHAYAEPFESGHINGRFCVQFMTFYREAGEAVRHWWGERCLEWCYDRVEDGKLGDQRYLDDWPERFGEQVHVLERRSATLAPWNTIRFPADGGVFFHFHGLRICDEAQLSVGRFPLPQAYRTSIYQPYAQALREAAEKMQSVGVAVGSQAATPGALDRARRLFNILHRVRRLDNGPGVLAW